MSLFFAASLWQSLSPFFLPSVSASFSKTFELFPAADSFHVEPFRPHRFTDALLSSRSIPCIYPLRSHRRTLLLEAFFCFPSPTWPWLHSFEGRFLLLTFGAVRSAGPYPGPGLWTGAPCSLCVLLFPFLTIACPGPNLGEGFLVTLF